MNTRSPHLLPLPVWRLVGCLTLPTIASLTSLEAATWNGGGTGKEWSNSANWTGLPSGEEVRFESGGATTGSSPTSIVDQSFTIQSLTYEYNHATQRHVTEILEGATLTVTGGTENNLFVVGGLTTTASAAALNTSTVIQGAGALHVIGEGKTLSVGNIRLAGSYDNPATATLDLSGLSTFVVDLGSTGSFNIGASVSGLGSNQVTKGVIRLAQESTITAGTLRVGSVGGTTADSIGLVPSELYFGANTTLNVNTIAVGVGSASRATGQMGFDPSVRDAGATLTIRGADGVSAVSEFKIGFTGGATSSPQRGHADFSGGAIDLHVGALTIGTGRSSATTSATANAIGSFTMDEGRVVATTVTVGQTSTGAASVAINEGTLNIHGGEFSATTLTVAERLSGTQKVTGKVTISGDAKVTAQNGVILGRALAGTDNESAVATLDLLGGSLNSGGNIGRSGTGTNVHATLNVLGGEIELNGHGINVDVLNLREGTLSNVGSITSGNGVVKRGAETLTLEGVNSYAGETIVEEGTLRVDGSLTQSDVVIRDGAILAGSSGSLGGEVTLEGGSTVALSLRAGGGYDHLSFGSLLIEEDVNLSLQLAGAPIEGSLFSILTGAYTGVFATINGVVVGIGESFFMSYDDSEFEFQLVYNTSSIDLQAIPEPTTIGLLGIAGLALILNRRRFIP